MAPLRCPQCGAECAPCAVLCPACAALLPFDPSCSLFAILGLGEAFDQDAEDLRGRALELQRRLHPDRFAKAPAALQRRSLEWSTRINEAAAILGDPLRRADYLFSRRFGQSALSEAQGSIHDPALLMRQMEYREQLEDIAEARDQAALDALRRQIVEEEKAVQERVAREFASSAADRSALAADLQEWQYLRKLRAELDRREEAWELDQSDLGKVFKEG